ncbi:Hypothetical predicted protein [Pelobates cultripes]|uniref:Uncharacterized protein n=1 Tax=Pelobates cultripes TaxID=61616 RepID=A0AAD1QYJ4_PELCU|nr:Hypothetical predicted protein [Pelobates cultripes]
MRSAHAMTSVAQPDRLEEEGAAAVHLACRPEHWAQLLHQRAVYSAHSEEELQTCLHGNKGARTAQRAISCSQSSKRSYIQRYEVAREEGPPALPLPTCNAWVSGNSRSNTHWSQPGLIASRRPDLTVKPSGIGTNYQGHQIPARWAHLETASQCKGASYTCNQRTPWPIGTISTCKERAPCHISTRTTCNQREPCPISTRAPLPSAARETQSHQHQCTITTCNQRAPCPISTSAPLPPATRGNPVPSAPGHHYHLQPEEPNPISTSAPLPPATRGHPVPSAPVPPATRGHPVPSAPGHHYHLQPEEPNPISTSAPLPPATRGHPVPSAPGHHYHLQPEEPNPISTSAPLPPATRGHPVPSAPGHHYHLQPEGTLSHQHQGTITTCNQRATCPVSTINTYNQ